MGADGNDVGDAGLHGGGDGGPVVADDRNDGPALHGATAHLLAAPVQRVVHHFTERRQVAVHRASATIGPRQCTPGTRNNTGQYEMYTGHPLQLTWAIRNVHRAPATTWANTKCTLGICNSRANTKCTLGIYNSTADTKCTPGTRNNMAQYEMYTGNLQQHKDNTKCTLVISNKRANAKYTLGTCNIGPIQNVNSESATIGPIQNVHSASATAGPIRTVHWASAT